MFWCGRRHRLRRWWWCCCCYCCCFGEIFVPRRFWFPILIVNCRFYILGIKDPEEKKKAMMDLFESLPTPNRHTSIYLLDHLRRYVMCSVALVKCRPRRGDNGVPHHHRLNSEASKKNQYLIELNGSFGEIPSQGGL